MPAVAEPGRVAADASGALDEHRRAGRDRIAKLTVSIMPVYTHAECTTRSEVRFARRPNPEAGDAERRRRSLEHRQRLADGEAELRVERQRAVVVGRLHKPCLLYPSDAAAD